MKKLACLLVLIMAAYSCQPLEDPDKDPDTETQYFSYVDESNFIASFSDEKYLTPVEVSLNRKAQIEGYNSVYGFNIPKSNQVMGFKWNTEDQNTKLWRPQGITGFTWEGRRFLLTTWYGVGPKFIEGVKNQHKGVRVSLVDITNPNEISYRHILLVQDKKNIKNPSLFRKTNYYKQLDLFAPITIHAGGVAYANEKIYVASTSLGLRVFDLKNIISVKKSSTKSVIGKDIDGSFKAFNYEFILPQSGYYRIYRAKPFSCVSIGNDSSDNTTINLSQYKRKGVSAVYSFKIDNSGIAPNTAPEITNPKDNATANNQALRNIQGVYKQGNTNLFAVTGKSKYKGSTARLVRYVDGNTSGKRYRWSHGAEDLYLEKNKGLLWNLTEYETSKYGIENRTVFAVRYSDYK